MLAIASATLQQAPSKGAPGADKSTATVQDIMATMIGPASKAVFGAVSSEVTPTGTVEKFPRTDAEWAAVRRQALTMVEGANLLLTPAQNVPGEGSFQVRVSKERLVWNKLAIAFRDAANGAVKAAEARRQQDFGAVSEAIDTACENCHLRYWYPDQETLLKNAPKPK